MCGKRDEVDYRASLRSAYLVAQGQRELRVVGCNGDYD